METEVLEWEGNGAFERGKDEMDLEEVAEVVPQRFVRRTEVRKDGSHALCVDVSPYKPDDLDVAILEGQLRISAKHADTIPKGGTIFYGLVLPKEVRSESTAWHFDDEGILVVESPSSEIPKEGEELGDGDDRKKDEDDRKEDDKE